MTTEESSKKVRVSGRFVMAADLDDSDRFLWRGPLHSGVLQQVMQTELSLPVQNCW